MEGGGEGGRRERGKEEKKGRDQKEGGGRKGRQEGGKKEGREESREGEK